MKGIRMSQVRGKLAALAVAALMVAAAQVPASADGAETLKKLQAERVALVKKLTPSVVAVADKRPDLSNPGATGMAQGGAAACSGFVVDDEYVVTNFESAETNDLEPGAACWLMAHDGTEFAGKVVGKDKRNLMLVVKMDEGHPKLPSLKFANSDKSGDGLDGITLGQHARQPADRQVRSTPATARSRVSTALSPWAFSNPEEGGDAYRGNVFEVDCARTRAITAAPFATLTVKSSV
jgi:S1-C subfamily serine protease